MSEERGVEMDGSGRERAYFEMVILVPDSAMILFRVLPPFPAEQVDRNTNYTQSIMSPKLAYLTNIDTG